MHDLRRLDVLLFESGYFDSRQKAQNAIASGYVSVNSRTATKPGAKVSPADEITISPECEKHVGRGYYKLRHALDHFGIDLTDVSAMDVGASTGGFTECMLERGACKVLAIDVGHDQLAPSLKSNNRVISMESADIRDLTPGSLPFAPQFVAVDVSFISLSLVLRPLRRLLDSGVPVICLVKPQFEAGRAGIGKNGIVRDESVRRRILEQFSLDAPDAGFSFNGIIDSPITGTGGNVEYLAYLIAAEEERSLD